MKGRKTPKIYSRSSLLILRPLKAFMRRMRKLAKPGELESRPGSRAAGTEGRSFGVASPRLHHGKTIQNCNRRNKHQTS